MSKTYSIKTIYQQFDSEKGRLRAKILENCPRELIVEYKLLHRRLCDLDAAAFATIEELKRDVWKKVKADKKHHERLLKDLQKVIEMKSGLDTKGLFIDLIKSIDVGGDK